MHILSFIVGFKLLWRSLWRSLGLQSQNLNLIEESIYGSTRSKLYAPKAWPAKQLDMKTSKIWQVPSMLELKISSSNSNLLDIIEKIIWPSKSRPNTSKVAKNLRSLWFVIHWKIRTAASTALGSKLKASLKTWKSSRSIINRMRLKMDRVGIISWVKMLYKILYKQVRGLAVLRDLLVRIVVRPKSQRNQPKRPIKSHLQPQESTIWKSI